MAQRKDAVQQLQEARGIQERALEFERSVYDTWFSLDHPAQYIADTMYELLQLPLSARPTELQGTCGGNDMRAVLSKSQLSFPDGLCVVNDFSGRPTLVSVEVKNHEGDAFGLNTQIADTSSGIIAALAYIKRIDLSPLAQELHYDPLNPACTRIVGRASTQTWARIVCDGIVPRSRIRTFHNDEHTVAASLDFVTPQSMPQGGSLILGYEGGILGPGDSIQYVFSQDFYSDC